MVGCHTAGPRQDNLDHSQGLKFHNLSCFKVDICYLLPTPQQALQPGHGAQFPHLSMSEWGKPGKAKLCLAVNSSHLLSDCVGVI